MKNELTTAAQNQKELTFFAGKAGTSKERLSLILSSQENNIKKMLQADEERTINLIGQTIFGLAEIYTTAILRTPDGITESARLVCAECTNIVKTKFSLLGLEEIKEAFRAAAAGEINASFNTWNNKFTVPMFTAILKAYKAHRANIRGKYETSRLLLESRKEDENKEVLNTSAQNEVLEAYNKLVDRSKAGEEITINLIPFNWYSILTKCGTFNPYEDKYTQIQEEARKRAISELKTEIISKNKTPFQKKDLKSQLNGYLQEVARGEVGAKTKELRPRIIAIYKKLVVLQAIKNESLKD